MWAQELVSGDGIYAAHYAQAGRVLVFVFVANRTNAPGSFDIRIDAGSLLPSDGEWRFRKVYPEAAAYAPLGDGRLRLDLPALERGPIGLELKAIREP